ncbi:MAG: HyaD/HybD family hydrogenase maturation endopeptidase [Nevskiales bacterium]|nr:HyaD/HybD family hydrogenase maturation endopeptidase [Nevskiales bacterium]
MSDSILVLGIGNLLWADEGFGVRCVEALDAAWTFPEEVELLDGGTQGLYLLPHVEQAEKLLVFDAIDWGLAPGTLQVIEGDAVPRFMGAKKMSLHQTGFQEVLACAELRGRCPELVLIGVQPVELEDYGGSLREPVRAQIAPALALARQRLADWGAAAVPRESASGGLCDPALQLEHYESGRPDAAQAWRHGDARFRPR